MDGFLFIIGFALVVAVPSFMLGLAIGRRQVVNTVRGMLDDEP